MIKLLRLIITECFGGIPPKLNGANLFSTEFTTQGQYLEMSQLFDTDAKSIARIPIQGNSINQFIQSANKASAAGIEVIASLDSYESTVSMINRLQAIKSSVPNVKYFEILNELPHMNDLYPGEKITSLKQLLDIVNLCSDWVHQNVLGGKAITMAPYNSMDERSWDTWDGVTNTRILKELILYTVADISAVHLYGDSLGKKLQLVTLADNIAAWNKEAQYKKKIWVTECGSDTWGSQVKYYDKIIKLIMNLMNPEKIIWYRQCTKTSTEQDHGYALEILDNGKHSPLFDKLLV
jgi:hypothetical protein